MFYIVLQKYDGHHIGHHFETLSLMKQLHIKTIKLKFTFHCNQSHFRFILKKKLILLIKYTDKMLANLTAAKHTKVFKWSIDLFMKTNHWTPQKIWEVKEIKTEFTEFVCCSLKLNIRFLCFPSWIYISMACSSCAAPIKWKSKSISFDCIYNRDRTANSVGIIWIHGS